MRPVLDILLIEDEAPLRDALRRWFARAGDRVASVDNGESALGLLRSIGFDLVVLDADLNVVHAADPNAVDAAELCRRLREQDRGVPIIMLSAGGAESRDARAAGADGYVRKPVAIAELGSCVRSLLRHTLAARRETEFHVGDLTLDPRGGRAFVAGRAVVLTVVETALLYRLMERPRRALTADELSRGIWGDSARRDPRVIDAHVMNLREKLEEEADQPRRIVTDARGGYRLDPHDE